MPRREPSAARRPRPTPARSASRATATDLGGLATNETFNIAVTTTAPPASVSLFSASSTPAQTNLNDGRPLEVGMKFTSSTAGQITALKFYRSPGDTGPDLLDLWTATGTKLASATFTNTTASGWQTVSLATPVAISANTTYIVSYHTTGTYVATNNYFTARSTTAADRAIQRSSGGNGVYAYGGTNTTGIFPTNTFGATNYWVDVVFTAGSGGGGGNTAPTAVADTSDATEKGGVANGSGGLPASGNVLTNDTDPDAGDTKTVTAVSFGTATGTLGTRLQARTAPTCSMPQAPSPTPSTRPIPPCRPAVIDQYHHRCLQLHHARYGRRHLLDHAHGHGFQHADHADSRLACRPFVRLESGS